MHFHLLNFPYLWLEHTCLISKFIVPNLQFEMCWKVETTGLHLFDLQLLQGHLIKQPVGNKGGHPISARNTDIC